VKSREKGDMMEKTSLSSKFERDKDVFFSVYQKMSFSHPHVTRKQDVIGSDVMGCVSAIILSSSWQSFLGSGLKNF